MTTHNDQASPLVLTNKRGLRFVVTNEQKILGRSATADFVVDCASVSRAHARIGLEKNVGKPQVIIEDLGSLNGTFIAESRVTLGRAAIGDSVRFGNVLFLVQDALSLDECSTISGPIEMVRPEIKDLSPAQQRVLYELLEGNSEKDVASNLNLSPHTIHNHIREIYTRFGVHSRAELMAKCFLDRSSDDGEMS